MMSLKAEQKECIKCILRARMWLPTGFGKRKVYLLQGFTVHVRQEAWSRQQPCRCIATVSLMVDQVRSLRSRSSSKHNRDVSADAHYYPLRHLRFAPTKARAFLNACAYSAYQPLFPPPRKEPGDEAST